MVGEKEMKVYLYPLMTVQKPKKCTKPENAKDTLSVSVQAFGIWTDLLSKVYTRDIYTSPIFIKSLYHFHDYKFNSADADTAININILKTLKQSTGKWNRYNIWVWEQHQRKVK